MTYSGKQLLDLGVPQNKIKYFVNREFGSESDIFAELSAPKKSGYEKTGELFNHIWNSLNYCLPTLHNGNASVKMSKSELRRLMDQAAVLFNGRRPAAKEDWLCGEVGIAQLIFFPNSKKHTVRLADCSSADLA